MTSVAAGSAARPYPEPAPGAAARAGMALWRLFCSVDFAVLQIIVLALLAVVGMTVRQLPGFAFRSATDYATEMTKLRIVYEPALGSGLVDVMERLQLFRVFTSTWFTLGLILLAVSIVICTLDRTPRLWHQSAEQRVVQPEAYFDLRLPDRVSIAAGGALDAGTVAAVLRRHRFVVTAAEPGASPLALAGAFVYGDRNRWTKMATLISHLGLILFLVAGVVTARLGDEQGLVVAEGDTLTVQPIGTPGLLLVQNLGFSAPGLATGNPTDFTTDLAVFRDGVQVARKTIRVNDPLTVDGYTFHQNGFGPALDLVLRNTKDGSVLWSGPVALTDSAGGLPYGTLPIAGKGVGLQLLLDRGPDGVGAVVALPYVVNGTNPDGTPHVVNGFPLAVVKGETKTFSGLETSIEVRGFSEYTLLIAKRDPGAPVVWFAFLALITGLVITFYLPRRRVWARVAPDGRVDLVGRSDRYVDFDREFGSLVGDLVRARGDFPPPGAPADPAPAEAPIAWVRVMRARVPAFEALDAGDLAIVPAGVVASLVATATATAIGDDVVPALASALVAAPVSGAVLVDAESADATGSADPGAAPLDLLAAALATSGVPALRLARADVVALERSVIGFLVARSAELERRASALEAELAALALEGGGAPALVAAVGSFLGRAVALETADGTPVAVHAPGGIPDAIESVARYRAKPRRAVALRVPLPAAGGAGGALALLGTRAVAELERVVVGRVAGLLALELARDEAVRRAGDQARRAEGLPSDGPPWVMLLARQRRPGIDGDDAEARARRDAVRRELRLLAPARRMALRGDADSLEIRMVVATGDADPEGEAFAARIGAFLDRTVALSRPFAAPHDRPEAEAEARATLEAATGLPEPPRIARAARLPVYRLMGALHNLPDGERLAAALLGPILATRPDVRREYLETLRAILDGGGVNGAATGLGVHRNTIAYRLRRIEALTGWDLADPELRLALSVALVFVHSE